MSYQKVFQRVEKKYLMNEAQYGRLLVALAGRMRPDAYGETLISNLYFDTPDHLLVRRSLEKPVYKEKLRLRAYGLPEPDGAVFLEIKKKVHGVVYKRRISLPLDAAMRYALTGAPPCEESQIFREIDYMRASYGLSPVLYLAYERTSYESFEPARDDLRITIDRGLRYRETDVALDRGSAGKPILPADAHLMEIKARGGVPLWLSRALSEIELYPTSFSKYGAAYRLTLKKGSSYSCSKASLPIRRALPLPLPSSC